MQIQPPNGITPKQQGEAARQPQALPQAHNLPTTDKPRANFTKQDLKDLDVIFITRWVSKLSKNSTYSLALKKLTDAGISGTSIKRLIATSKVVDKPALKEKAEKRIQEFEAQSLNRTYGGEALQAIQGAKQAIDTYRSAIDQKSEKMLDNVLNLEASISKAEAAIEKQKEKLDTLFVVKFKDQYRRFLAPLTGVKEKDLEKLGKYQKKEGNYEYEGGGLIKEPTNAWAPGPLMEEAQQGFRKNVIQCLERKPSDIKPSTKDFVSEADIPDYAKAADRAISNAVSRLASCERYRDIGHYTSESTHLMTDAIHDLETAEKQISSLRSQKRKAFLDEVDKVKDFPTIVEHIKKLISDSDFAFASGDFAKAKAKFEEAQEDLTKLKSPKR
jgi:hypothetical protein